MTQSMAEDAGDCLQNGLVKVRDKGGNIQLVWPCQRFLVSQQK